MERWEPIDNAVLLPHSGALPPMSPEEECTVLRRIAVDYRRDGMALRTKPERSPEDLKRANLFLKAGRYFERQAERLEGRMVAEAVTETPGSVTEVELAEMDVEPIPPLTEMRPAA